MVEVVKGLLGKDISESSSLEVLASKSHVRNALGLPGTRTLGSLWLVEWEGIVELEELEEELNYGGEVYVVRHKSSHCSYLC